MQLTPSLNTYNPFPFILEAIPHREKRVLTGEQVLKIMRALSLGGVGIESGQELAIVLEELDKLGLLDVDLEERKQGREYYIKVGNKYNGKD